MAVLQGFWAKIGEHVPLMPVITPVGQHGPRREL